MEDGQPYSLPNREHLKAKYVGKSLSEAPIPSAILDVSKIRHNCELMLHAVNELDVSFRAHVKTHKTLELTRFQLGSTTQDFRLICSTLVELERLKPLLKDYQQQGAIVNVLYGVPPGICHADRLATFVHDMGPGTLSLMIDNPAQLAAVSKIYSMSGMSVSIFLKTDSGYHRAGLPPKSSRMQSLVAETLALASEGSIHLLGFYSHNSHSYGGSSPLEAMDNLRAEIDACTEAALTNTPDSYISSRKAPLYISCGASPTALSLQNLLHTSPDTLFTEAADALRASLAKAKASNIRFEIHAGVYPILDMQQISACSRASESSTNPEDSIALSILTEVCSTYPDRTQYPEALVNAGTIALGREPCKSYRGHGVITPWNMHLDYNAYDLSKRMVVDRVSQEHGLLQWEDQKKQEPLPLTYGQRVRIWPNHACITGSHFEYYLIVDSEEDKDSSNSKDVTIRDVWVRWRGW